MYLKHIILTHYKNYESKTFNFNARFNVITGNNGVGKTNLLDSIYYLCMTKSFFGGIEKNNILKGQTFARLDGDFQTKAGKSPLQVVTKIVMNKKKAFEVNGKEYDRLVEHIGRLPIVMIAPEDTLIATGGSEQRRKFSDITLSQKNKKYLESLIRYNRLLKQRNALLKSKSEWLDMNLLQSYNDQMIPSAEHIFEVRKEWAAEITPIFDKYYRLLSGEKESVEIEYQSSLAKEKLSLLFDKALEKDKVLERTTEGIHKDDFSFRMDEMPLKRFASQGQRKSFVIALKLAQYQFLAKSSEELPILLMDDIFDKLDKDRVTNLIEVLGKEDFGQVFITDTHPTRVSDLMNIPFQIVRP